MKPYTEMSKEELKNEIASLKQEYKRYQSLSLSLDMSRGKPCKEQLDLSMGLTDF